jgi:hypothetical protein
MPTAMRCLDTRTLVVVVVVVSAVDTLVITLDRFAAFGDRSADRGMDLLRRGVVALVVTDIVDSVSLADVDAGGVGAAALATSSSLVGATVSPTPPLTAAVVVVRVATIVDTVATSSAALPLPRARRLLAGGDGICVAAAASSSAPSPTAPTAPTTASVAGADVALDTGGRRLRLRSCSAACYTH